MLAKFLNDDGTLHHSMRVQQVYEVVKIPEGEGITQWNYSQELTARYENKFLAYLRA